MTHLVLIQDAIILAAGILGGYSLAQRQPDPDDPRAPSLSDVSSAPVPEPKRAWWLPERHPGRFVPWADHNVRRLMAALDEMRASTR